MRVLFLADHRPDRAPGQRFRWEQYLPYLRANGVECDVSFVLSEADDRVFYGRNDLWGKAKGALRAFDQRRVESSRAFLERYDVVFIHRRALFYGPPVMERRIARARPKLVFDFDDAIWVPGASEANRLFGWLKYTHKTAEIVRLADLVIAGNPYLEDFARREGARRIEVIPTTIDTEEYRPIPRHRDPSEPLCIGWTGSFSTIVYFEHALPALRRIKARYRDRVRFKVVGDGDYRVPELDIVGLPWRKETELEDLREMDIGIMPLPPTEWCEGKCALKGLQYMALGIPTVMSPVGVNTDVLEDGVDGYLAGSEEDWVQRLSELIDDAELRRRLGEAGRETVEKHYSVHSQRERYLNVLRSLAGEVPSTTGHGRERRSKPEATSSSD